MCNYKLITVLLTNKLFFVWDFVRLLYFHTYSVDFEYFECKKYLEVWVAPTYKASRT